MNKIVSSLMLVITVLGGAAHASDLTTLERKVAIYATQDIDQFKNPCVCNEPGEFVGAAGILRYAVTMPVQDTRRIHVWCQAWRYDFLGDPVSTAVCDTFTVLAK